MPLSGTIYERWRQSAEDTCHFRDQLLSCMTPKRLRILWLGQPLKKEPLTTLSGKSLRILNPGYGAPNRGPLLRRATMILNGKVQSNAEVLIDPEGFNWQAQRHDLDPAYAGVKLVVTWRGQKPDFESPEYVRMDQYWSDSLDAWRDENLILFQHMDIHDLPKTCHAPLRNLKDEALVELVRQGAVSRLWRIARAMETQMNEVDEETVLWNHLFRSMGYRLNQWPMHHLSQYVSRLREGLSQNSRTPVSALQRLQARLLGCGGFLNLASETLPCSSQSYYGKISKAWEKDMASMVDIQLPEAVWNNQGIRPANHPQRRLATLAHWLLTPAIDKTFIQWFETMDHPLEGQRSLLETLGKKQDPFWGRHWTLHGRRLEKPKALLGHVRINEIVLQTLFPWLLAHFSIRKDVARQQKVVRFFFLWPPSEDHTFLESTRRQLFGSDRYQWIQSSADQLGLLQIMHDFCGWSDGNCNQCLFRECAQMVYLQQGWILPGKNQGCASE